MRALADLATDGPIALLEDLDGTPNALGYDRQIRAQAGAADRQDFDETNDRVAGASQPTPVPRGDHQTAWGSVTAPTIGRSWHGAHR
jgi:hypothetical protein